MSSSLVIVGNKKNVKKLDFVFVKLRGNKQFLCHLFHSVVKQGLNVKITLSSVGNREGLAALVVHNW